MADMTMKQWYEEQFLPWKQALANYLNLKKQNERRMQQHVGQLQTIVALLLEGRTRQALIAWNSLKLQPELSDLALGPDGQVLVLTLHGGKKVTLMLDDLMDDLQALLDQRGALSGVAA